MVQRGRTGLLCELKCKLLELVIFWGLVKVRLGEGVIGLGEMIRVVGWIVRVIKYVLY